MRKAMLLCLASVMAIALVPGSSRANHCLQVLVFSGQGNTVPQQNPALNSDMLNAGAVGCTSVLSAQEQADTRYLTPGAIKLTVGIVNYPQTDEFPPSNATLKFDNGAAISLTLTFNRVNQRWNSQVFTIPAGATTVTASARVNNATLDGYRQQTTTYKKLA